MLNVKHGSYKYQLLKSFILTRLRIEPTSIVYEADALIANN